MDIDPIEVPGNQSDILGNQNSSWGSGSTDCDCEKDEDQRMWEETEDRIDCLERSRLSIEKGEAKENGVFSAG